MNLVRHDLSTAFETGLNPTNVRVSSNQLISSRTSPQLCTSKSTVCNHVSHVDEKKKTHIEPIRRHDLESSFSVGKTPRTVATKRERQNCCKISLENWPEHGSSDSLTSHTKDILFANDNRWPTYLFFFFTGVVSVLPEVNLSWIERVFCPWQISLSCREFV